MNLKQEILSTLKAQGKCQSDVIWAGNEDFKIDLKQFWQLCDTNYDDGYGSPHVATDLVIVGKDFWLERHEYDGSEWFEYKSFPKMPSEIKDTYCLTLEQHEDYYEDDLCCGWNDLKTLNCRQEY